MSDKTFTENQLKEAIDKGFNFGILIGFAVGILSGWTIALALPYLLS